MADTGLIECHHASLFPIQQAASTITLALAASLLLAQEAQRSEDAGNPWASSHGWRLNGDLLRALRFTDEAGDYQVGIAYRGPGAWLLHHDDTQHLLRIEHYEQADLRITLGDVSIAGHAVRDGDMFHVFHNGQHAVLTWDDPLAYTGHSESESGCLTAPMPGKIVAVLVETGQRVDKGMPLLIMEAMKMEHSIAAPADGVIDELLYLVGDQVTEGAQLLAFTPT